MVLNVMGMLKHRTDSLDLKPEASLARLITTGGVGGQRALPGFLSTGNLSLYYPHGESVQYTTVLRMYGVQCNNHTVDLWKAIRVR